jgi:hypothetical protein
MSVPTAILQPDRYERTSAGRRGYRDLIVQSFCGRGAPTSEPQLLAGSPTGLAPVNERERLRNRVDLIVVTNARKSEQLGHEL